jgi:hypothetical protein
MYELAYCYESGTGVEKDDRMAFLLYVEAAIAGDGQSIYEVSRCYWYAIGTAEDKELSVVWRRRAEARGINN